MLDRASKSFQMAPQAITAAAVLLCSLAGGEGGTGRSSAASPPFSAEPQHREEALCAENDGVLTSRTNPGLTQAALRDSKQPKNAFHPGGATAPVLCGHPLQEAPQHPQSGPRAAGLCCCPLVQCPVCPPSSAAHPTRSQHTGTARAVP